MAATASAAPARTALPPVAGWRAELLRVGTLPIDAARVFPRPAAGELVTLPVNALLLERPERSILVDAGPGCLTSWWDGATASPPAAVAAAAEVDLVILTHLDFDHVGGLFAGRWPDSLRPELPGARVAVLADAVRGARAADPAAPLNAATHVVELLERLGLLVEVADDTELAPGVWLRPAPGHRAGHAYVEVAASDGTLLHLGDALHHPLHVAEPLVDRVSDADPELALETRRRLTRMAADRGATVVASHLPGAGHIELREDGAMTWKD